MIFQKMSFRISDIPSQWHSKKKKKKKRRHSEKMTFQKSNKLKKEKLQEWHDKRSQSKEIYFGFEKNLLMVLDRSCSDRFNAYGGSVIERLALYHASFAGRKEVIQSVGKIRTKLQIQHLQQVREEAKRN